MRILLVEDDKRVSNFVKRGLQEEGFAVDLAENGEIALTQVQINPYDLVILDVVLPEKDGVTVCRQAPAWPLSRAARGT